MSEQKKGWRKVSAPKRWSAGDGEVIEGTYQRGASEVSYNDFDLYVQEAKS